MLSQIRISLSSAPVKDPCFHLTEIDLDVDADLALDADEVEGFGSKISGVRSKKICETLAGAAHLMVG